MPEVWYRLYIGDKGKEVDCVDLEEGKTKVAYFRREVKKQWRDDIPYNAAELKVYRANTDPTNPDESLKLEGNVSIPETLNEAEKELALIVIAPPPKEGDTKRKRESEDKSTNKEGPNRKRLRLIGDAYIEAEKTGSWRQLPAWNRELHTSKREQSSDMLLPIFEREIYEKLAKKLHVREYKRQVVTGMPGIGKSWFVDYFAQFCLKKGDAVILETDRLDPLTSEVIGVRRLELLVPTKNGDGIKYVQSLTFSKPEDVFQFAQDIKEHVGSRDCWNLIDYQKKEWNHVLDFGALHSFALVLFASPDRQRWKDFFQSEAEKGQEPILIMPVWTGNELHTLWEMTGQKVVNSFEELEVLVSLFGPSPRYCFSQFCLESTGKCDSELEEERQALLTATIEDAKRKATAGRNGDFSAIDICSSSDLLEKALVNLNDALREKVRKAAQMIRGRIMTAGVVEELENIHDSPTGSTCESNVTSRLLVWGVQGDSFSMDAVDHRPYVAYASPYIAAVVLEHNSKQALRSMARFFESGDRNVGAGSGWMYENFLLKYYFPSLKAGHEIVLQVIGSSSDTTEKIKVPPTYNCCIFGELKHASFQDGAMCIPTYRTLGAVDCFMILNKRLYLFQVTTAANHSIVKSKLEELIALAKKHCNFESVELVFVIPSWRKAHYLKKAQPMSEKGKIVRVTGELKKDNKETLKEAILAIEAELAEDERTRLLGLWEKNQGVSTHQLRQELKKLFAASLKTTGYQDNSLETWSVPRLVATYSSKEFLCPQLVARQSIWVVDKDDMPGDINGCA